MTEKRNKWIILFFLLLVVFICLAIWQTGSNPKYTTITSHDGVWDVRGVDFGTVSVRLSGDVEYVPNALLSPEEFAASDDILLGVIPDDVSYLTSRVRLLVSDDRFLGVAGFADDFGSRLYLNGKCLTDSGKPGTSREDSIPSERFLSFTAGPVDGVIEIVQQGSNFVFRSDFRSGTKHTGWTIGLPEVIERWDVGYSYSYIINMGIYLTLFLAHLLLFLMLPSYRANLWFALLCLAWAIRTGVTRVRPLVLLFNIGWTSALRMEYLTAVATFVLITLAYTIIFPGVFPKKLCTLMYTQSGGFTLLYIFSSTLFMSQTVIYFEIVAGIWAAYGILRIVSKLSEIDLKQKIIVAGLGIVLSALILDTLYYNNINFLLMHNVVLETAVIIFSLFQMTAMFLGTMEEMAAAREAEQKLALENAALDRLNRLKTDLMATISHEMRTPLAVMMGFAQLTAAELKDKGIDEQATADLDAMAHEAQRLARLVEEMQRVSLSRQFEKSGQFSSVDTVIRQITRLYAPILERKNTLLVLDIPDELPPVACGPNELTQVMFNILNNADKHIQNGEVRVKAALEENVVALTVSDTGSGIAPELLSHVFEQYCHGEDGGTGIGLFICKEILEAQGGHIAIDSMIGQGTTVRLVLPLWNGGDTDA